MMPCMTWSSTSLLATCLEGRVQKKLRLMKNLKVYPHPGNQGYQCNGSGGSLYLRSTINRSGMYLVSRKGIPLIPRLKSCWQISSTLSPLRSRSMRPSLKRKSLRLRKYLRRIKTWARNMMGRDAGKLRQKGLLKMAQPSIQKGTVIPSCCSWISRKGVSLLSKMVHLPFLKTSGYLGLQVNSFTERMLLSLPNLTELTLLQKPFQALKFINMDEELTDYFTAHAEKAAEANRDFQYILDPSRVSEFIARNRCYLQSELRMDSEELRVAGLLLRCGRNVLFHGYGSKYLTINMFFQQHLSQTKTALIFNGFSARLTPSAIYKKIIEYLRFQKLVEDSEGREKNLADKLSIIKQRLPKLQRKLLLVVHSLDGPNFSTVQAQEDMSGLCTVKQIQMIGSIETCKFGLLLNQRARKQYNFSFVQINTYAIYQRELNEEAEEQENIERALSGLRAKIESMTKNQLDLLRLWVELQISRGNGASRGLGSGGWGMSLGELLAFSQKNVIVADSSSLTHILKALMDIQLVECVRNEVFKLTIHPKDLGSLLQLILQRPR